MIREVRYWLEWSVGHCSNKLYYVLRGCASKHVKTLVFAHPYLINMFEVSWINSGQLTVAAR